MILSEWFEVLMWEKGELFYLLLTHALLHVLLKQLGCLQNRKRMKCS